MYSFDEVKDYDLELANAMEDELARQRDHIELIASENFVSKAVMAAMGSPLTNKYAEGYPGKRYYGGCDCVDVVEDLARERAKELFGCEYVNVQPHSGAQANMAVQFAMLKHGDTIMGMNLDHGGHLTHGSPVNFSGKYFNIVPYGVNDEGFIDYDEVMKIAKDVWNSVSSIDFSGIWNTISSLISSDSLGDVGASLGKIGDVGDLTSFWPYIVGLLLILFVVQLFELPFQLVWNGLVGAAMLWLINLVGGFVGFGLKITVIKALIAGFFGIPGALAIVLFEIFG